MTIEYLRVPDIKKKKFKKFLCFGLLSWAIILLFVVYNSTVAEKAMGKCIFCDIVHKGSPKTKIEVETEEYVIFKDIKPASVNHYLCVPKQHVESVKTMTKEDIPLVSRMEEGLKAFFKTQSIDTADALFGFHMPPFISVKHLHMHGIAPRSSMSWINYFMFNPFSFWFKTVEETINYLESNSQLSNK